MLDAVSNICMTGSMCLGGSVGGKEVVLLPQVGVEILASSICFLWLAFISNMGEGIAASATVGTDGGEVAVVLLRLSADVVPSLVAIGVVSMGM
eukprot:8669024-Pyramimonas_sp.AAC.1